MLWAVVLEKTLESLLDCKEIQPVHPKGDQSWIFIGRTDAEAEAPILWPPDSKNWLTGKDPDTGKDWGQKDKGLTEDEMVGWHHWCDGHEFEQTPGAGDGQGSLACCSPWGHKELDKTEQLNWLTIHFSNRILQEGSGGKKSLKRFLRREIRKTDWEAMGSSLCSSCPCCTLWHESLLEWLPQQDQVLWSPPRTRPLPSPFWGFNIIPFSPWIGKSGA